MGDTPREKYKRLGLVHKYTQYVRNYKEEYGFKHAGSEESPPYCALNIGLVFIDIFRCFTTVAVVSCFEHSMVIGISGGRVL